ncbi:hypothetical protein N7474_003733 [Penicillium riverlandense]|uniref:uncharacterized protein n=1 Tax=Penicillium riverlandense TaxID=1903569 RepID=UPI0025483E85|nr:uncharacterized protein N7474_003733 [Penicillium riverlandense]KAJ5818142.1 hypothetical protein N7474_003733 [Penicillium riverlandense]
MESLSPYDSHHWGWPLGHEEDDCNLSANPVAPFYGLGHIDFRDLAAVACDSTYQSFVDTHGVIDEFLPNFTPPGTDWTGQQPPSLEELELSWPPDYPVPQFPPSPPLAIIDNHGNAQLNGLTNSITCESHIQDSSPKGKYSMVRRRPRRQNHSCDPCRSSKKACDLARGISARNRKAVDSCSGCKLRGIDCTVSWLASKQLVRQANGSPDTNCPATETSTCGVNHSVYGSLGSLSTIEADLSRRLVADGTCSQKFNLFLDISDSFLSHCLLQGSMPPPYNFGVAAYDTLSTSTQLSAYIEKTERWVASCWQDPIYQTSLPLAPGPNIFRTVSALDAIFAPTSLSSRDASITETYKWVAIATAAQLANCKEGEDGLSNDTATRSRNRDIALATWRKAKEMVFKNIAATGSFRLALSLMFFGDLTPPHGGSTAEEDKEDRGFAFCEGIRRLKTLCSRARNDIKAQKDPCSTSRSTAATTSRRQHHIQNLPPEVSQLILELTGAVEWLVSLYNAIAICTSYGRICAFPPEAENGETNGSPGSEFSAPGSIVEDDTLPLLSASPYQRDIEDSILTRARQSGSSFIEFCQINFHKNDAVLFAGRLPVSLSILIWRSLASFTIDAEAVKTEEEKANYTSIARRLIAMTTLIEIWETHFGTMDQTPRLYLEQSHREVWKMSAFCSMDTDLAILLFYDIAKRLETNLMQLPSTTAKERLYNLLQSTRVCRSKQRLRSAMQIAIVSSTCQGPASPNAEPLRQGGPPTYGRYMCAHPSPWMMIQGHTLASQAFSDEMNNPTTPPSTKQASEMTAGLNICLRGLLGLRDNLFIGPGMGQGNDRIMSEHWK